MKKRRLVIAILMIISLVNMMIAFNKTLWRYGDLELDRAWSYLPNQYASPMENMPEGMETIDLSMLSNGLLSENGRIRGTLYKTIELPRAWLGEDLMLFNNVFRDNAKIYINGQLVAVQGSFSTMGSKTMVNTVEQYIPIETMGRELTLMVLFDGYTDHIEAYDDLYLMPSKQMLSRLNLLFGLQTSGFILTLILLIMVALKPLPKYQKRSEVIFVMLIILRWASVVSSPIVNLLPISLNFWIRFGAVVQILMLCYALIILFERKEIWKKRLNVGLAVGTFIIVITLLLYENINVKWVVLSYAAVVTGIYIIFRHAIKATDRFAEMLVVNACLFADVIYRIKAFSPPMHLFILAVYGVIWHFLNARSTAMQAGGVLAETLPKRIESIEDDEIASIYEEIVDKANMMAICLFETKTVFSSQAEVFFGDVFGYKGVHDILLPNDAEQAEYLKEIMERILAAHSLEERIVYLELLPKGLYHGSRYLSLEGHWSIKNKCLILLISDVTASKASAERDLKDRHEMETAIEVLRNQQDFIAFQKNYEQFIRILNEQLRRESCDVLKLMTFVITKLNFFIIKLKFFKIDEGVVRLERIVSDLNLLQSQQKMTALVQFDSLMESYHMPTLLDDVFERLTPYLNLYEGDSHRRLISIAQLKSLEDLIETLPENETKLTLKSQLWRTQHLRFKELVKTYNQYTQDLAKALGKKVREIEIIGDEIYIDYDRNDYFAKGCLIIINNAVMHGIETPAERIRRSKSEWGTIHVELLGSTSEIGIIVSDDGRGFDVEGIKTKMIEAHPDAYDVIKPLSDEAVLTHLIHGDYVYKETSGMGLDALKNEVDALNGTLRIETKKHVYSRLIITIPNEKAYVF